MNENFSIPIKEMEKSFRSALITLPVKLGNEGVNFALDNFKRQAFLGNTAEPWRRRKNPTKWGQAPKRNGRAILVDSGRLRRSIRITSMSKNEVRIGTDVPYAKVHNEGLRIGQIQTVKGFTRKNGQDVKAHTRRVNQRIPKRQFLGSSPFLTRKIERVVLAEVKKALR